MTGARETGGTRSCEYCRAFVPAARGREGQCRLLPPVAAIGGSMNAQWAVVKPHDWCLQWTPRADLENVQEG
jgi:hypothetical protein